MARSTRIAVTLAASLAAIALAAAATLAHAPLTVARGNATSAEGLVSTVQPAPFCQGQEALPRGTVAIRLALLAALGPQVRVTVSSGSRVLTGGVRAAGWSAGTVTVPVRPLAHTAAPVRVCVQLSAMNTLVTLRGWLAPHAVAVVSGPSTLPGRMGVEYLRPSGRSWWSRAGGVVHRLGFGHAFGGPWPALLVAVLAAAVLVLSCRLVLRELS